MAQVARPLPLPGIGSSRSFEPPTSRGDWSGDLGQMLSAKHSLQGQSGLEVTTDTIDEVAKCLSRGKEMP